MAVDRAYTFGDGTVIELRDVSQLAYYHISTSEAGKPQPPLETVVYAGGHKRKEFNFANPDYVERLEAWNQARSARVMRYIIVHGVATAPADEVAESYRQYLDPSAAVEELKYMWILERMADEAEISRFMEAVISQTMVTSEGLVESEAAFPDDGGREADPDVSVQGTADGEDHIVSGV